MPRLLKIETTIALPDGIVAASKAISEADERLRAIAKDFSDGAVTWSFVVTKPRVGTGAVSEAADGT